jgi:CheY-like chemotaxis protein
LARKMGGTISVESEIGVGTTFAVTLPLKATDKVSAVESFSANSTPKALVEQKHILLVEDYEPNVMVASAMIEQMEYNFDIARNGFEALRKFMNGKYDVVLMDVQMHELDGLEATRRIRKLESDRKLCRTPIVAMTAHVREQDKNKCLDAGMDDFIPKPFDPAILQEKIERYVKMRAEISEPSVKAERA